MMTVPNSTMKPLFNDPVLQEQFDRLGFVKVQIFDEADVAALWSHYDAQKFDNDKNETFFVSLDDAHPENARRVTKGIEDILFPKLEGIISDYQTFAGSFIVKEPGERNVVPPHQDWTFVDESMYYSASIWTPLIDVNEENGALGVIPGSHTLFNYPRASPSPQYNSRLKKHASSLFPYIEVVEMKAGESLIFNNQLIHASLPNLSSESRVAVGIGITFKEARLIHYYLTPGVNKETLEVYEVDADFFNEYSNSDLRNAYLKGKSPDWMKKIDTIENRKSYNFSNEELMKKIVTLPDAKINTALIEKMGSYFCEEKVNRDQKELRDSSDKWDTRTIFQKYSPGNVAREIAWRLKGKPTEQ